MTIEVIDLVKAAMVTGAALSVGFGGLGTGLGNGIAAGKANEAITRNPKLFGVIFKNMLVGMAVAESAAIFALVVGLLLLFSVQPTNEWAQVFVILSAGACMGVGAIGSGLGCGYPVASSCTGIARQPMMANKLTANMLIGSAVCQTPCIFALVVSFILIFASSSGQPLNPYWAAVVGAGLATGVSAIWAGFSGGLIAEVSCEGAARQPKSAGTVLRTMLLGQAVMQTAAIYGLLVSFVLLFKAYSATTSWAPAAALIGSGIAIGFGTFGPCVGEAFVSRAAIKGISRNHGNVALLTRTMLVGMAICESIAIYALIISLVLLFVI